MKSERSGGSVDRGAVGDLGLRRCWSPVVDDTCLVEPSWGVGIVGAWPPTSKHRQERGLYEVDTAQRRCTHRF